MLNIWHHIRYCKNTCIQLNSTLKTNVKLWLNYKLESSLRNSIYYLAYRVLHISEQETRLMPLSLASLVLNRFCHCYLQYTESFCCRKKEKKKNSMLLANIMFNKAYTCSTYMLNKQNSMTMMFLPIHKMTMSRGTCITTNSDLFISTST